MRKSSTATNVSQLFRLGLILVLVMALVIGLTTASAHAEPGSTERTESTVLKTNDLLAVSSNRESLQFVEIRGNLSASMFSSPQNYPTDSFNLTSSAASHYSVRLFFNYPSEYNVDVGVYARGDVKQEIVSYYVSSGELHLTLNLDFEEPDGTTPFSASSIWDNFTNWTARFGDAFPLWVKVLYVLLGVQFTVVGYKWIKFEDSVRGDGSTISRFDRGNLVYLWSEVLFKFLLTALLAIAVAMGGQLILLTILNFMFLAPVTMLSLWDLFVLGFAAGISVIAYVIKFFLEKSFDLKPFFQD